MARPPRRSPPLADNQVREAIPVPLDRIHEVWQLVENTRDKLDGSQEPLGAHLVRAIDRSGLALSEDGHSALGDAFPEAIDDGNDALPSSH